MRKFVKTIISLSLVILITIYTSLNSDAYYCTKHCYDVCKNGLCSLNMSCPAECDGHQAAPCFLHYEPPTCTEDGKALVEHCVMVSAGTVCDKRDRWEIYPALGHDFGLWECVDENQHKHVCGRWNDRTGSVCGYTEYENHTFDAPVATGYVDHGDTHTTTYKKICNKCGYTVTYTQEEPHTYNPWIVNGSDTYTATRECNKCGHTQSEWIGIEVSPLNNWTAEYGVVKGFSKFWNDCPSTTVHKQSASLVIKNVDTNVTSLTTFSDMSVDTHTYTENKEGRYAYTYKYTDDTNHDMSITLGNMMIDHSAPQLNIRVSCGGTDDIGTHYNDAIEFTQSIATHSSATGAIEGETRWTNTEPTITATATDYLKNSTISGVGVHSVVIYDDMGNMVAAGTSGASYTLKPADEGTHTYTIVATDHLARDPFTFGDYIFNPLSVYAATGTHGELCYTMGTFNAPYDVNHITVARVITHYDCTAPMIVGAEDFTSINVVDNEFEISENCYLDSRTVYAEKNILEEIASDFYTNSVNADCNDSSDIATVTLSAFDKDGHETILATASRDGSDVWSITQSTAWSYNGVGFNDILACSGRSYSSADLITMVEEDRADKGGPTVTRSSSSVSSIYLNTDPRYDANGVEFDPVTQAMLTKLKELYEYYEFRATDVAGNRSYKKIVPGYAELRTLRTTIDPSTYKDPDTGELKH